MSDLSLPTYVAEIKGCFGKVGYDSAKAAIRVVNRMEKTRRERGSRLTHYRCKFCHQHHIGNEAK